MTRAILIINLGFLFLTLGYRPLYCQNLKGTNFIGTVSGTEDYSSITAALADLRASTITASNIDKLDLLNNIFHVENTVRTEVNIGEVDNLTMDHNLFSGNADTNTVVVCSLDGGYTEAFLSASLGDWQTSQSLYDQGSKSFDPVFAETDDFDTASHLDYRFGALIEDITSDIDGDSRDISMNVDVGAGQYPSDEGDETNSSTKGPDDSIFELIQPATSPVIGLDLPKGTNGENLIYDMDGDGDNDFLFFAVGPAGGYQYIAYLNDGENHYQRMDLSYDFGVSSAATRPIIRVADLNQDGINDIIVGGERPGNSIKDLGATKVFFGDTEGQLHYQSQIALPSTGGGEIRIEDFNGDNYPDIFLTSAVRGKLYLNDGSENFTEDPLIGFTDAFVLDVAVSKPYNGGIDVIVEIFQSGFKNVIYRYESGVFTEVMRDFRTINANHATEFGDANGDGFPDLFILDANQTLLYLNDQSGNYALDTSNSFDDLNSQYAYTLHFTDLNDDGAAEVVFTKAFQELAVFWNDGTGNYGSHQTYEISNVGWVTIGDLNSDGFPDFVNNGTTDVPNPSVTSDEFITRVYINDKANAFERAQLNVLPQFRNGDIQLLDANEDGHHDLLVSGTWYQGTESTTQLYLNDGTGEFTLTSGQPFEGLEHASIALADFNGDMHEDVVLSGINQNDEVHTSLYLGDGAGGFSQDMLATLSGVQGISVSLDANGDDHPDLLVIGNDGVDNLIAELYLNNGSGTLTLHEAGLTGLDAVSVAAGDLDGDNDADLLIRGIDAMDIDQTLLYTNDGTGNFTEVTDHGLGVLSDGKVLLSDIDGDEDLDIYLSGGGQFLIYENDGIGNFTETQSEEGPSRSTAEFGDIDLDGDPDIVESGKYGDSEEPRTFVYYNDGDGHFARDNVTTLHGIFDGAIAMGDLDHDQDLEIMLSGAVWDYITSSSRTYRNTSGDANDNAPTVTSVSLAADNSYLDVTFSEEVYNTNGGTGALEVGDFVLSITGGSAANPIITSVKKNDNTVEASASALVGGETTVRIFFSTTGTPDGGETLTVNPADGNSIFNAVAETASTSQSNNSMTMNDQVAPLRPPVPSLDASTNSGPSDSDGITNHTVLKITGTAEPLSTITVDGSFGRLGVTTADASGDWFVITAPQEEGDFSVSFTATDAANNVSERSFPLGIRIDLTAPVASIQRHMPTSEFHSGSEVKFVALFNESVENVDGEDFSISGPAASGADFLYSEAFFFGFIIREITVSNITTEGQLNLDFTESYDIIDLAGNAFNGAISSQQSYTIDNTVPTISSVTTSIADRTYGSTDQITIQVNFTEAVTVTGVPTLELETGNTDQKATYTGVGSGTSTLEFSYIVQSGDANADLDYTNTNALSLNGGSIKDQASLDAILTLPAPGVIGSLGANANLVVDGSTPTFTAAQLGGDNSYLDVSFTEGAYSTNGGNGALEASDFALSISGGSASNPMITSVKRNDNVLESSASVLMGGEITVRIFFSTSGIPDGSEILTVDPADGNSIFDTSGNAATTGQINNVVTMNDQAGPVISAVSIPNTSAKVGDAIPVTIDAGETGLIFISGMVNGVAVTGFSDNGDNSYTVTYTVEEGHTDRPASEDVPVRFVLADGIGNLSAEYTTAISQNADLIDANSPSNSITAPITTDNIINGSEDQAVVVSGTTVGVENGRLVVVLFDDGANPAVRVQANTTNNTWTAQAADISGLNNGNITVTANLSDFAENPAPEAKTTIVLDNVAPPLPSVPDLDASTDSGHSDSDNFTKNTVLKINGTAEANSVVTVTATDGILGTATADISGDWSITTGTLSETHRNISVTAMDLAGNISEKSFVLAVTIDLTPPTVSLIDRQSPATENTNGSTVVFRVYFNAQRVYNVDVSDFVVSGAGAGGTATIASVNNVFGNTTYDVTINNINKDGELNLDFSPGQDIIDLSGNPFQGTIGLQQAYIIDQIAPEKPLITGISDDTGSSDSDGITSDKNITISGTAEPDAIIEVSSQFGPVRSVQADGNGHWLLDISDITLVELMINLTAEAVDMAGNRSETSDVFVLTPDFTAPAKAVITGISEDTGASSSDGITNDKNITVKGTAEPNVTVEISSQFGPVRSTLADANGDWLLDITDITLFELVTNLTAEAVDLAGNRSEMSDVFVLTPDFTAPAKPVITGISGDTGASSSDGITNDKNITISGTAEPNVTVEVSSQFGPLRHTQADFSGNWLLDISDLTLVELTVNLTAEAVDLAGNRSEKSNVFVLIPDFTPPAKPMITGISDDTGASSSDGITNDKNITISGTAEPDATVEVSSQFGPLRNTQADVNGEWLLDISDITLLEIVTNLTAEAVDVAGNRSATSNIFVLTPDFTAPRVTISAENSSATTYTIIAFFDEEVNGLSLGGITVTGGTASNLVQNNDGSHSFLVSLSGSTADVQINAGAAQDIAGNDNVLSNQLTLDLPSKALNEGFTNLSEITKTEVVSLHPNPASKILTIDLSELTMTKVDIGLYDMGGSPVFMQKDYDQEVLKVDVSSWASGLYIVHVYDGPQVFRKKVIVRK